MRLAGQVPILRGNEAQRKQKQFIRDTLNVFHLALKKIFAELELAAVQYVYARFYYVT